MLIDLFHDVIFIAAVEVSEPFTAGYIPAKEIFDYLKLDSKEYEG
ncbi:hypothetical protein [Ruminococcus sp.]|nr:hypothetical protein [Ruminococcus sp.]